MDEQLKLTNYTVIYWALEYLTGNVIPDHGPTKQNVINKLEQFHATQR